MNEPLVAKGPKYGALLPDPVLVDANLVKFRHAVKTLEDSKDSPENYENALKYLGGLALEGLQELEEDSSSKEASGCATGTLLTVSGLSFVSIGMAWFMGVEGLSAIDSLYFVVVILTTVGYGVQDELGSQRLHLFLTFYVMLGVCLLYTGIVFYFSRLLARILSRRDDDEEDYYDHGESMCSRFFIDIGRMDFPVLILMWLSWLLGGALLLAELENWTFIQAVYFAVISGSTVGFGDFEPENYETKIFIIIYLPPLIALTLFIFTHSFAFTAKIFIDETYVDRWHIEGNFRVAGYNTPAALSLRKSISGFQPPILSPKT